MTTPKFRLTEMIKVGGRESLAISINEAILGKAYCIIALHIRTKADKHKARRGCAFPGKRYKW